MADDHVAETAALAFAHHAERLAAEYDRQRDAILESDDPEGTHRARVALRRLRSLVTGFAPILGAKAGKRLEKRLKDAFRDLGPLRDADVRAESLAHGPQAEELAASAAALRADMRQRLRAEAGPGLAAEMQTMLADPRLWQTSPRARRLAAAPAAVLAQRALQGAWSDVLAYGDDLAALDIETRHDFRKDMKTLRYLVEFFAPLWPDKGSADFIKRMQKLQDALGVLNDLHTLLHPIAGDVHPRSRPSWRVARRRRWRRPRSTGTSCDRPAPGGLARSDGIRSQMPRASLVATNRVTRGAARLVPRST